jgi:iron complex transport system ATP-binding protein
VIEVVLMGRMPHQSLFTHYSRSDRQIAQDALEKLSIGHLQNRVYTEISGGERQLTLIARALAQGADVFIMDEPVSGLDYGNQIRLLERIHQLAGEGYSFSQVQPFSEHALLISDRVILLSGGVVLAEGLRAR